MGIMSTFIFVTSAKQLAINLEKSKFCRNNNHLTGVKVLSSCYMLDNFLPEKITLIASILIKMKKKQRQISFYINFALITDTGPSK